MTLPPYCPSCGTYHAGSCTAIPANRLAALRPPPAKESAWGWVALIVLGVIAALSVIGWCA